METAARIIWWIMLIVLIITQFISNLAIIRKHPIKYTL